MPPSSVPCDKTFHRRLASIAYFSNPDPLSVIYRLTCTCCMKHSCNLYDGRLTKRLFVPHLLYKRDVRSLPNTEVVRPCYNEKQDVL